MVWTLLPVQSGVVVAAASIFAAALSPAAAATGFAAGAGAAAAAAAAAAGLEHSSASSRAAARLRRTCTPQAYGARANGVSVDTAAINAAIAACGTVSFPSGGGVGGRDHCSYLTGTIRLRSNTRLVLEEGATVLAAPAGHFEPAEAAPPGSLACTIAGSPYMPACQDYGHCHWADVTRHRPSTYYNLTTLVLPATFC
eukprot:SAG31_NODE_4579_length_3121_cov_1.314692_3_plen_198_part_00